MQFLPITQLLKTTTRTRSPARPTPLSETEPVIPTRLPTGATLTPIRISTMSTLSIRQRLPMMLSLAMMESPITVVLSPSIPLPVFTLTRRLMSSRKTATDLSTAFPTSPRTAPPPEFTTFRRIIPTASSEIPATAAQMWTP